MIGLSPLKHRSIVDTAAEELRACILSGELEPGRIVTEKELSETWQISRPTAKMALRDLIQIGLIRQTANHSAHIKVFTPSDLESFASARRVAEAAATASFLTKLPELPLPFMKKLGHEILMLGSEDGSTSDSRAAIREHEVNFHRQFVELIDNPYLTSIYKLYGDAFLMATHQLDVSYSPSDMAAQHTALLVIAEQSVNTSAESPFRDAMFSHIGGLALQEIRP